MRTTQRINETVASLDRAAERVGLPLRERGRNSREFDGFGRTFRYRPGGRGLVRVEAYVDGLLDSVVHRTYDQMVRVFVAAKEER